LLGTFDAKNQVDANGNPSGGSAHSIGVIIEWQDGPLGAGADRKEPNGAFVETVIAIAKQRLEFYESAKDGEFACPENAGAISGLNIALEFLDQRTARRQRAGIEGTHTPEHIKPSGSPLNTICDALRSMTLSESEAHDLISTVNARTR
jgi:hypothetical protein